MQISAPHVAKHYAPFVKIADPRFSPAQCDHGMDRVYGVKTRLDFKASEVCRNRTGGILG